MPGLRGALSVRVNDGVTDRIVTRYCRGLKFTKTAPGGHRDISFTMVLPRNTFTDLGPADNCWLYDARTSRTIFGKAYTENPTPIDGPDGQQYDISAVGGMALANDETRALIYIDTRLDGWERSTTTSSSANVESGSQIAGTDYAGVQMQFPSGSLAATNAEASAGNYTMQRVGMTLGAIHAVLLGGKADANWAQQFVTPAGTVATGTLATGPSSFDIYVGAGAGSDIIPSGTDRFAFRLIRIGGSTNVADEQTWFRLAEVSVLGRRMDRNGTLLTGGAGLGTLASVTASQVVEDLVGRLLTFCDAGTAQVDATTFGITQLAWPDGVKAADVLTQLAVFESGYLWEILESLDNGKHRFAYRAWPTTPRYEVSVKDGWRQTGSDVDLCNRILITWTDAVGNTQVTSVTAASLGLSVDALGTRVKDADPITLPDGFGSTANATRIGGQILTDKIQPPTAGTVLVRRPIIDQLTGSTVMPWEIEPGYLCRIRETGDNLRITQVDYDDDSCSMLLTLGAPVLTIEQRLARLARAAA